MDFPDVRPIEDPLPELARYTAALRRLQDLTVSTNPGGARRHHSAALRLAVRDDGDRRGYPADTDRVPARRLPQITPIDEPLEAHGSITEIDGGKVFIAATMTAADGAILSEANGLMVRLFPYQP